MHKYFAKPLFLGKKVQFLPECHSTNEELMKWIRKHDTAEGFLIYTDNQLKGKGQRGNIWLSEPGKNLLFSFLILPKFLLPKQFFILNLISGLAMVKVLKKNIQNKKIELKWPNDAYVEDRKIAGILIETSIESSAVKNAVVGIGLNVNQDHFQLPSATSMKIESDRIYDREGLLESYLVCFEGYYLKIKGRDFSRILQEYYKVMRWRGENHSFKSNGHGFAGEILGIDGVGKLIVNVGGQIRKFDVKEIEFLY